MDSTSKATLKTTQGQINGSFRQLPFKCYLPEGAYLGYWLKICPWVAFRVVDEFVNTLCHLENSQLSKLGRIASERRGNILQGFTDFDLNAIARIWP